MENWRDIPGFEGRYQASIDTPEGKCRNTITGKELNNKPKQTNNRIFWHLTGNEKDCYCQAAKWIALTYPELVQNEYFDGAEIDHIDGNRLNNHPSNLRWVDRRTNLNNPITRKRLSASKINRPDQSKWVIKLSKDNEILHFYPSISQASRETGINSSQIASCCRGKPHCHTAGGFIWKYAS